jgi:tRNA nucleotidyltransferase (CCA-adding enzyme)
MRAARFEQRLGFTIEPRTAELIDNALPMLARVTGERIRHELTLILGEREPERALRRLDGLDVLAQIHPALTGLEQVWARFAELRQAVTSGQWQVVAEAHGQPPPGLYLALMTYDLTRPEVEALCSRLRLFRDDRDLLRETLDLRDRESALAQPSIANHELYELLHRSSPAAVLVVWLCTEQAAVRERLWRFESELRHVQPLIDGEYLKGLGLKPSPLFRKLLNAVRDARLDGEIHTIEEEKALVNRLLAEP